MGNPLEMAIFNSYVKLPESIWDDQWASGLSCWRRERCAGKSLWLEWRWWVSTQRSEGTTFQNSSDNARVVVVMMTTISRTTTTRTTRTTTTTTAATSSLMMLLLLMMMMMVVVVVVVSQKYQNGLNILLWGEAWPCSRNQKLAWEGNSAVISHVWDHEVLLERQSVQNLLEIVFIFSHQIQEDRILDRLQALTQSIFIWSGMGCHGLSLSHAGTVANKDHVAPIWGHFFAEGSRLSRRHPEKHVYSI